MVPDELDAVQKAKTLYRSCMNESESNTLQKTQTISENKSQHQNRC